MDCHQHQKPVEERMKALFNLQNEVKEMIGNLNTDGFSFEQATEKCDEFLQEMNRLIKGSAISEGTSFPSANLP